VHGSRFLLLVLHPCQWTSWLLLAAVEQAQTLQLLTTLALAVRVAIEPHSALLVEVLPLSPDQLSP
jgi:hypothetical protein